MSIGSTLLGSSGPYDGITEEVRSRILKGVKDKPYGKVYANLLSPVWSVVWLNTIGEVEVEVLRRIRGDSRY